MSDLLFQLLPVLTALLGASVTFAALRPIRNRLESEIRRATDDRERAESETARLRAELQQASTDYQNAKTQAAVAERSVELTREAMRVQQQEIADSRARLREEFQNIANSLMEEKSAKFTQLNKENLDQLLAPLNERIQSFREKVEEVHSTDKTQHVLLKEQIDRMMTLNQQITQETRNLTEALTTDTRQQGHWGEVVLTRILEYSGLREGHEYRTQQSYRSEDGSLQRPDVVILLPDERFLIIDSKVSLTAYERSVSGESPDKRAQSLHEHVGSLRQHIAGLKSRSYEKIHGDASPEFVLMFIPVEPAFSAALQHEPELYREAFEKRIILVSPTTLMATLATIETVWRQERQTQSALEIASRGGRLLDKLALFLESMDQVGQQLGRAQQSYEQAVNRLRTGHGNLMWQAEKLRELGVSSTKETPEAFRRADFESDPDVGATATNLPVAEGGS